MPTKNNNNRKIIRYEVRNNSDIYSEGVFKYLTEYCTNSDPQSYIDKIVKAHTLPLGLSLDHEHYRHVVLESLTFLLAQVDLIENVTGISLKPYSPELVQPSMVAYSPRSNSYPTVQPSLRATGAVNQTPTPTVIQSENEVVSKFGEELPIEELPITEKQSETTNSETVLSTLSTFEELEQKLNELLQKIADGGDILKISRLINNLEPEDEEAWTEEMWNFYDLTRHKVSKSMNPAYIKSQEQS